MPAEDVLAPLAQTWREWLPVGVRDSPDHLAVLNCYAREFELLRERIAQVRAQFVPQTADLLLGVYEAVLQITVNAEDVTIQQRRDTVLSMMRRASSSPAGRSWVSRVSKLIGPGWTYDEHDPDDPGSPPEYTVRVLLPVPPSSTLYAQTERLLRDVTPAHLDIQVQYAGGFLLDESQLDQEGLG